MKSKFKVISFIMAATLLVSTAAVLAGVSREDFGVGESKATARLECSTTWARANTYPITSYNHLSTYITGTTASGTISNSGTMEAYITANRFIGACSTHSIDGIIEQLTVSSN